MTYNDGYALKRKEDGTYYVPKRKREDGSEYVPAEYAHVSQKCLCEEPGYCTNFLASKHSVHLCVNCGAIMPRCLALS